MSNQHILDYLEYYIGLRAPEYAVMVNGAWGIGKTFAIQNFMKARPNQGIIYLSLYGVKSSEEIDQRIVAGMMPALNTTVGKIGGRLIASMAKTFQLGEVITAGELSKIAAPDMIIFDDFERAAIEPVELLGYINQWVEHERKRVVILVNEAEVNTKSETYAHRKEKVVGTTFEFQQDIDAALNSASSLFGVGYVTGAA